MKKKKVLAGALAGLLGIGAVAGIAAAVRMTTSSSVVRVVPASEINYNWGGYETTTSGYLTNDVSQDIYLSGTESVTEVRVAEGDRVHEGDVLMVYDTTRTALNLEMARLDLAKIELDIDVAEQNLKILNGKKPVSDGGGDGGWDDGGWDDGGWDDGGWDDGGGEELPPEPVNPLLPSEYPDAKAYAELNGESEPFNAEDANAGTADNPYRFLCRDGAVITPAFVEKLKSLGESAVFFLEIREGDSPAGAVRAAWLGSTGTLEDPEKLAEEGWTGYLTVSDVIPQGTAAPTPTPGPEPTDGPEPTESPEPTERPEPTEAPEPTESPEPTEAPEPTESPEPESEAESSPDSEISGGIMRIAPIRFFSASRTAMTRRTAALPDGGGTISGGLISRDAQYTKDELAAAKEEQQDRIRDLELDKKETELKIEAGQKAMAEGQVKAAMDGVVRTAGDPLNPPTDGSAFLTVTGTEGLYVRGGISELMLDQIHVGDSVSVLSWESGEMFQAVIKSISPYPDTSGMFGGYYDGSSASTYPFTAVIEGGSRNLSNMEWVQIQLRGQSMNQKDGLFLWKAFIRDENGRKYVWKMGEDERLHKQYIEAGTLSNDAYEVLSGLTEDDYVAFPYGKAVKEGARTKTGTVSDLY